MLAQLVSPQVLTVPGFWSSFWDWAAETTYFTNELVEIATHAIRNQAEAADRRGLSLISVGWCVT